MSPDEYRRYGIGCLKAAEEAEGPGTRALFLGMAQAWLRLAEFVENNPALLGAIASTIPATSVDGRTVEQQQQQPQPTPPQES